MTSSKRSLLLIAAPVLLTACEPGKPTPCDDGYAAYSEAGATFKTLPDVSAESDGTSMVLHVCAGTHVGTFWMLTLADDPDDAEEAEFVIVGAGESTTFLDGEGIVQPLSLHRAWIKVSDLTIQNGGVERDTTDEGTPARSTMSGGAAVVESDVRFERVTFSDNIADDGAAMTVHEGSTVTLKDSHILRNTGDHGSAVALRGPGSTLISENTDWADNLRADVSFIDDEDGDRLDSYNDDGSGSFTCVWDTVSCE